LNEKRNRTDLLETFKMFIGKSSLSFDSFFEGILYHVQEVIVLNLSNIDVIWTYQSIVCLKE